MRKKHLIRSLTEAAPVFEQLDWLKEVVLFGPALEEDPFEDDVDLLLVARRTLSREEKRDATGRLRQILEDRIRQSLDLRIATDRAIGTPRGRELGHGRIFEHQTVSVFRRES